MVMYYRFTVGKNEHILKKDTAILHIDREAYNGALYLTNERLVFVGHLVGVARSHEKAALLKRIREIKGKKTFFLIPNVLDVTLDNDEHFTIIVHRRDEWLEAIRREMALAGHEQPHPGTGNQVT